VIVSSGATLRVEMPEADENSSRREGRTLEEVEREYILHTLEKTNGRIKGAGGAAEILDLNRAHA
jgi:hypothetical protein